MELYPNSKISNPRQGIQDRYFKKDPYRYLYFDIGVSPQESFFI